MFPLFPIFYKFFFIINAHFHLILLIFLRYSLHLFQLLILFHFPPLDLNIHLPFLLNFFNYLLLTYNFLYHNITLYIILLLYLYYLANFIFHFHNFLFDIPYHSIFYLNYLSVNGCLFLQILNFIFLLFIFYFVISFFYIYYQISHNNLLIHLFLN